MRSGKMSGGTICYVFFVLSGLEYNALEHLLCVSRQCTLFFGGSSFF